MSTRFNRWISSKTLSRELATLLVIFTCYLGWTGDATMAEIFIGPSFLFAAAAFGLDAAAKKLNMGRSQGGTYNGDVSTNINVGGPPYGIRDDRPEP